MRARVGYDGFTADVWSLGVCLFAMLSGFFPLEESSDKDPQRRTTAGWPLRLALAVPSALLVAHRPVSPRLGPPRAQAAPTGRTPERSLNDVE